MALPAFMRCDLSRCKHLLGFKQDGYPPDEATERHTCCAFPNGIPDEIAYGDNLHLEPFPGDNGIQYERAEDD